MKAGLEMKRRKLVILMVFLFAGCIVGAISFFADPLTTQTVAFVSAVLLGIAIGLALSAYIDISEL